MRISGKISAQVFSWSTLTMGLTCILAIASYFFGQPLAVEVHWFWMLMLVLSIIALSCVQYLRARMLQQRDDELRGILDAVPHALFFKDTRSRYRVVNAEFERQFNLHREEVIGKSDGELFGPEFHERLVSQDRSVMALGEAQTYEVSMPSSGGARSLQSRKQPVRDRRGRLRGIVGVAIDVTDQMLLQSQLEDANDRLRVALDAAGMGTWEWNIATGALQADERAKKILGLADVDAEVDAAFARIHPEDLDDVRHRISQARRRGESAFYEYRIFDDAGDVRWIEGYSAPPRTHGGLEVMIGVNRDITERRTVEIALQDAKAQADRAFGELEESKRNLELALKAGVSTSGVP